MTKLTATAWGRTSHHSIVDVSDVLDTIDVSDVSDTDGGSTCQCVSSSPSDVVHERSDTEPSSYKL